MSEADDAVQEAWLGLIRTGSSNIENLAAWLTTVIGICLNMPRSREQRREEALEGVCQIQSSAARRSGTTMHDVGQLDRNRQCWSRRWHI
jgi:DNA-directed RNA polymerase specialized sigma24 family protein